MSVTWQVLFGSSWLDMDAATSAELEKAFTTSTAHTVPVSGTFAGAHLTNKTFDVQTMTWNGANVRRSKSLDAASRAVTYEYWDGYAWCLYDDYAHALIIDAIAAGRDYVAFHATATVRIEVQINGPNDMTQLSNTGTTRPVRVTGSTVSVRTSPLTVTVQDTEEIEKELKCPITQLPMVDPVTASDGFCYERTAIERWLSTKKTSPTTNLPLPSTILYPANNIKIMLEARATAQTATSTSAPGVSAKAAGKRPMVYTTPETAADPVEKKKKKMRRKHVIICGVCDARLSDESVVSPCKICFGHVACASCDEDDTFVCVTCRGE